MTGLQNGADGIHCDHARNAFEKGSLCGVELPTPKPALGQVLIGFAFVPVSDRSTGGRWRVNVAELPLIPVARLSVP
jgi:hypothetical protein